MVRRCLILIQLAALAGAAEEPLLHEERVWIGFVEAVSVSRPPPEGEGAERQVERIRFKLRTRPPRRVFGRARLPFELIEVRGEFELEVDHRAGAGKQLEVRRGKGRGRLHARVLGWVEPGTGRYRLHFQVGPSSLVAPTTVSGFWKGRFTTWRTVTSRRPLLDGLDVEGGVKLPVRRIEGERKRLDRRADPPRQVTLHWRLERVDPVLRGRVLDRAGRPLAGMEVVATTTNPVRVRNRLPPIRKETRTDRRGRFEIPAFWGRWGLRVVGREQDGIVVAGRSVEGGVELRPDRAPPLEIALDTYRLRDLPRPWLLRRHFRGDVDAYLAWLRPRYARWLRAVLRAPPAQGEVATK